MIIKSGYYVKVFTCESIYLKTDVLKTKNFLLFAGGLKWNYDIYRI